MYRSAGCWCTWRIKERRGHSLRGDPVLMVRRSETCCPSLMNCRLSGGVHVWDAINEDELLGPFKNECGLKISFKSHLQFLEGTFLKQWYREKSKAFINASRVWQKIWKQCFWKMFVLEYSFVFKSNTFMTQNYFSKNFIA